MILAGVVESIGHFIDDAADKLLSVGFTGWIADCPIDTGIAIALDKVNIASIADDKV